MVKMKMKMCALFVILALASQHASGVEVYEGEESVPLPCQFAAPISKDHVIVWRRDDLRSSIIHSIVDGNFDLSSQNTRYSNRTSMRADALKTGDISLTLRNPTFTDSGTYACVTRKDGEDKQRTEVQLKVQERLPVWLIILPVCLVGILLPIGVVFVFLLNRVKERQNSRTVGQLETVEVSEGAPSVLLPCKPTCSLQDAVKVKWTMVKNKDDLVVCVFENGQIRREQQHPAYKKATEMKKDALTEYDFSLTLRRPVLVDGGVYVCSIYDKHGNTMNQKVVPLLVREPLRNSIRAVLGCPIKEKTRSEYEEALDDETLHLNDQPV